MQTQIQSKNLKRDPDTLSKEIAILYELGLEEYEVRYLMYLKTKEEAGLKWKTLKTKEDINEKWKN